MSWSGSYTFEDGTILGAGGGLIGRGSDFYTCVILPVHQIENMSAKKIGEYAKALIPDARAGTASEEVDMLYHNGLRRRSIAELQKLIDEMTPFTSHYANIANFIATANQAILDKKEKECIQRVKKAFAKKRRKEFVKVRDSHFNSLVELFGETCQSCGEISSLTVDHIVPVTKGGTDDLDNLQLLCKSCNSRKGNR